MALISSLALFACSPMPVSRSAPAPSDPAPKSKALSGDEDEPKGELKDVHENPAPSASPTTPPVPPDAPHELSVLKEERSRELDKDSSPEAAVAGRSGLSAEAIERVVRSHKAEVRVCYDAALKKKPDARGKLLVAVTIDASGAVSDAAVQSSTFDGSEVGECVVKHVRTFRFPPPDGGEVMKVTYPYVFIP